MSTIPIREELAQESQTLLTPIEERCNAMVARAEPTTTEHLWDSPALPRECRAASPCCYAAKAAAFAVEGSQLE